jgi:hypothetical protein
MDSRQIGIDVTFFREEGYQVLRGLVDPVVVAQVREFLEAELSASAGMVRRALGVDDEGADLATVAKQAVESGRFDELEFETQQLLSGHFALNTRLSDRLWPIASQPGVRSVLEAIFEDNRLFMHMPPAARWVLPGYRQSGVPAHQDVSYNQHMSDFVTLWVPLVRTDEECGGVAVFAGSHAPQERPTQKSDRFWLESVGTAGFTRVHESMEPGDALLLNRWIVHESMPNRSARMRLSIDYRFFCGRDQSTKHHLDLQRMEVIAPGAGGPRGSQAV